MSARLLSRCAGLLLIIVLGGCSQLGYYSQAAIGQFSILAKRQSVATLIADPQTEPALRERLALANEIRTFALVRLGLDQDSGFRHFTELKRRYVTWNVVAAPRYSIEPKIWCFPIAGCVAYKGFFKEQRALAEQDKLLAEGYDVLVYGVSAYSTLGWFADPLLSTFINYPDADLAALIFHELSHQIAYVQDDSEFNEAFATAVELELLDQWLTSTGNQTLMNELAAERQRRNDTTAMVLGYRDRLAALYIEDMETQSIEVQKQQVFSEMKSEYAKHKQNDLGSRYYNWWFSRELDNADLLTVSTYYRLVPAFSAMIAQYPDQLDAFFGGVRKLAKQPKAERDKHLQQFLN